METKAFVVAERMNGQVVYTAKRQDKFYGLVLLINSDHGTVYFDTFEEAERICAAFNDGPQEGDGIAVWRAFPDAFGWEYNDD